MKRLLLVFVVILMLASCAPQVHLSNQAPSVSPSINKPEVAVTPAEPLSSQAPSCTPESSFKSSHEGESISDYFYTGDLERFFVLTPKEFSAQLGINSEEIKWIDKLNYLGITFEYDGFINFEEESESILNRIVLSSFNFRGLNERSNFEDVIRKLGDTKLTYLHYEDGFDFALQFVIGELRFLFISPDERGEKGLTLAVTPASQVFYISGGKGESISKVLTIGDINQFLKYTPEDLGDRLGNGEASCDEDTGSYNIYFDYIGAHFCYSLGETQKGDEVYQQPMLPLQYIWFRDFDFRGLNQDSTFEDIIDVLGKKTIKEIPIVDTSYFALQYKIKGLLFEFSSGDDQAGEGVYLSIARLN